jgi:hypothetical protein
MVVWPGRRRCLLWPSRKKKARLQPGPGRANLPTGCRCRQIKAGGSTLEIIIGNVSNFPTIISVLLQRPTGSVEMGERRTISREAEDDDEDEVRESRLSRRSSSFVRGDWRPPSTHQCTVHHSHAPACLPTVLARPLNPKPNVYKVQRSAQYFSRGTSWPR